MLFNKFVIGIFLFSLLLHGIITFTLFPVNVAFKYQVAAQQYLNHEIDKERLLDFSPLYLYVHIFARQWMKNPNMILLWTQLLLIALSSVLLFLLLRSFFNLSCSLIGTLAFITNRSVMLYASAFEPESFLIFFLLGFMVCTLKSYHLASLLAGIFLSLSLLTRSNFFPLMVMTPLFFWLTYPSKKKALRTILIFEIPVLAAVAFLILRSSMITDSFTPFTMNPGYVFYEGNNPNSTGESAIYPPLVDDFAAEFPEESDFQHEVYRLFARRITGQPLSLTEVNAYWTQKARNFIVDHPLHFLKLLLTKITFFFHNFRRHDVSTIYWNDQCLQQKIPLTIPFVLIAAMALIGMVLAVKAWKQRLILYAVFFCQFGIMLLTYISARQRVAVMAFLIFFAVETLNAIVQRKHALVLIVSVLTLCPFLYVQNDLMRDDVSTWNRYALSGKFLQEARQERKNGNLPSASEKNALAFALAPGLDNRRLAELSFPQNSFQGYALEIAKSFHEESASYQLDLAILSIEAGKLVEAELLLDELIKGDYQFNRQYIQSSQPYFYLARIYELKNKHAEATAYLENALAKNPGDPWVLSHLASLTNNLIYKIRLLRYFDDLDTEFLLGQAYLAIGKFEDAVRSFSYVAETLPEYRKGQIYLSLALGATGNYQQAAEIYLAALRERREPLFKEKETLDMFYQWAAQQPQNSEAKYYLGGILRAFGHYEEALRLQRELLAEYSSQAEVKKNIAWLENAIRKYAE